MHTFFPPILDLYLKFVVRQGSRTLLESLVIWKGFGLKLCLGKRETRELRCAIGKIVWLTVIWDVVFVYMNVYAHHHRHEDKGYWFSLSNQANPLKIISSRKNVSSLWLLILLKCMVMWIRSDFFGKCFFYTRQLCPGIAISREEKMKGTFIFFTTEEPFVCLLKWYVWWRQFLLSEFPNSSSQRKTTSCL